MDIKAHLHIKKKKQLRGTPRKIFFSSFFSLTKSIFFDFFYFFRKTSFDLADFEQGRQNRKYRRFFFERTGFVFFQADDHIFRLGRGREGDGGCRSFVDAAANLTSGREEGEAGGRFARDIS